MEAGQEMQENAQYEEEATEESQQPVQETVQEDYVAAEESAEQYQQQRNSRNPRLNYHGEDRGSFIHGLAVGLGLGCIATFVIMWIAVFFTPLLPTAVTYETLLSIFIYPLLYLLAVGLVALTAGIVREYYTRKSHF